MFILNEEGADFRPVPIFFDRRENFLFVEYLYGFCENKWFDPPNGIKVKKIFAPTRRVKLDRFTSKKAIVDPNLEILCPGMNYESYEAKKTRSDFGLCEFHGHTFYRGPEHHNGTKKITNIVNMVRQFKIPLSQRASLEKYWFSIEKTLPKESYAAVQALFFSPRDCLIEKVRGLLCSASTMDIEKLKEVIIPYASLAMGAESAAFLVSRVLAIFGPQSFEYQDIRAWALKEISHKSLCRHLFYQIFVMGITELCRQNPELWHSETVRIVQGEMIDFYMEAGRQNDPCDPQLIARVFQWMGNSPLDGLSNMTLGDLYSHIQNKYQKLRARENFIQKNINPEIIRKTAVGVISNFYLRAKLRKQYEALLKQWPGLRDRQTLQSETLKQQVKAEILTQWSNIVKTHEKLHPEMFTVAATGAAVSEISFLQQGGFSTSTNQEIVVPRVIAKKDNYTLLLIPLTIGIPSKIKPIMIGVTDVDATKLLHKTTFTVADFSENAVLQEFLQFSDITDEAIDSAIEHFNGHFLTNKTMSAVKL